MATAELMHNVRSMSLADRTLVMAVSVLMDRLQQLSQEDRDDLLALVKEAAITSSEDERCQIADTMMEIFEKRPAALEPVDLNAPLKGAEALKGWNEYIAVRVREAREAAGLTQEQLSDQTGLPQSHISRIETAKLSPSRITLEKIAKALNKAVGDFDCTSDKSTGD